MGKAEGPGRSRFPASRNMIHVSLAGVALVCVLLLYLRSRVAPTAPATDGRAGGSPARPVPVLVPAPFRLDRAGPIGPLVCLLRQESPAVASAPQGAVTEADKAPTDIQKRFTDIYQKGSVSLRSWRGARPSPCMPR